MSAYNSGPPTGQSDLAVMDVNEYKQKRRLERILDTHDKVEDVAGRAREQYITGEISEHGQNVMIYSAVRRYLRESHNLLYQIAPDGDEEPRDLRDITYDAVVGRQKEIGRIEREQQPAIVLVSLDDYYQCNELITETITEQVPTRHGPEEVQQRTVEHSMPLEASWNAYILLNLYLGSHHGIEIQMEQLEVDEDAEPF